MSTRVYYSDSDIKLWVHSIMRDIAKDTWRPDYIVGLTRGGLVPAVMLSHYMNVPMESLNVSFRDGGSCVSNCGMSEDAYNGKNILVVDDINDSGKTLSWIKEDWKTSCMPNNPVWDTIWGYNVRVAVMINNEASEFVDINYTGKTINKLETPEWCVFPWEEWWR
jgi:hypoxanthine phosphoribosyltransferase